MSYKKNYSMVMFDLFDTLILFEPTLLPKLNINGTVRYSTALPVFQLFNNYFEKIKFGDFYVAFKKSYEDFQILKSKENREFTNKIRFDMMFRDMGISGESENEEHIKNQLVVAHMNSLAGSMVFPESHRDVLNKIVKMEFRTCVLSNFDHAPTVYKLMDKFRIRRYFEKIFISDEIGWRKPNPVVFKMALNQMGVKPEDTILIGDNYNDDIKGAFGVGIDPVFVERKRIDDKSLAKFTISDLEQLPGMLEQFI